MGLRLLALVMLVGCAGEPSVEGGWTVGGVQGGRFFAPLPLTTLALSGGHYEAQEAIEGVPCAERGSYYLADGDVVLEPQGAVCRPARRLLWSGDELWLRAGSSPVDGAPLFAFRYLRDAR